MGHKGKLFRQHKIKLMSTFLGSSIRAMMACMRTKDLQSDKMQTAVTLKGR